MGVKVIFNSDTRIIEVKPGVTELDVKIDLYSDAKEDWLSDSTLNRLEFLFVPIGGNPIGGGQVAPTYFFLKYPWRLQTPGDGNTLFVALNLYGLAENGVDSRSADEFYIVQAGDGLSATNSNIPGLDSEMNNAIQHASFGDAISIDVDNGVPGTEYPIGNKANPVDNLADAITIDSVRGFRKLCIESDLTIGASESLDGLTLIGRGSEFVTVTLTAGCTTESTVFETMSITGTQNGETHYHGCEIETLNNVHCEFHHCKIVGPITMHPTSQDTTTLHNCFSGVAGLGYPTINMNDGPMNMAFRNYSGSIEVTNCSDSLADLSFDLSSGRIILASTVTAGTIVIRGTGSLSDSSSGATVNIDGLQNPGLTWDVTSADHLEVGSTGKALSDAGAGGNPWSLLLADNEISGSFGAELATKADIASSSSTNQIPAGSGTAEEGNVNSGTYASTATRDNTYWEIQEDVSTGIIVEATFNLLSTDHRPGVVNVFGRYVGTPTASHYMDLWAYNYESTSWEQLIEKFMPGGNTSDAGYTHEYFERHIDRDNNNEVKIRLIHNVTTYNAGHILYLDYMDVTCIEVITAEDIADAVWDEPADEHTIAGTMGAFQNKIKKWVGWLRDLL